MDPRPDPATRPHDCMAIVDKLHQYAFAIDDRDWNLLESVFLPDAVWQTDLLGRKVGFPAILESISRVVAHLDVTHHVIGNATVLTLGADEATTRCYLWAQHVSRGPGGARNYAIGGEYRDRFARTDVGWRISERVLRNVWTDGDPAFWGA